MANPFDMEVRGSVQQWSEELVSKVGDAIEGNMLKAAELAAGAVRQSAFEAFPGSRGGIARSYTATLLAPKEGKLRSGALSDLIYARIQDKGGTVAPRNVKFLTIPVSARAKDFFRDGGTAKEFNDNFERIKGQVDIAYVNRPVQIPATHYLDRAEEIADPLIEELFDGEIQVAAGEAEAGGE